MDSQALANAVAAKKRVRFVFCVCAKVAKKQTKHEQLEPSSSFSRRAFGAAILAQALADKGYVRSLLVSHARSTTSAHPCSGRSAVTGHLGWPKVPCRHFTFVRSPHTCGGKSPCGLGGGRQRCQGTGQWRNGPPVRTCVWGCTPSAPRPRRPYTSPWGERSGLCDPSACAPHSEVNDSMKDS